MKNNIELCKNQQLTLLRKISMETYRDTFAESNSEELLQQYFFDALTIEKLEAQLNTKNSDFYFIYRGDEVAGFLKLNEFSAQSDIYDDHALEVERFYIRQSFFRQGIGKTLMAFVCERAKLHNKKYIWLGVWEGNHRALAFYKQQGFYQFGEHPFDMGGDIQTDLLYRKDLE